MKCSKKGTLTFSENENYSFIIKKYEECSHSYISILINLNAALKKLKRVH